MEQVNDKVFDLFLNSMSVEHIVSQVALSVLAMNYSKLLRRYVPP